MSLKKLLLLTYLFTYSNESFAQFFKFGLKGGLNYSTTTGDSKGVDFKPGFHVGVFLFHRPEGKIAFMSELVYSQQGAKASQGSTKIDYSYVNLPLMINYYLTKDLFLQAGPQYSILYSAEVDNGTSIVKVKDQLESFDFGLVGGFGYDSNRIIVNGRYNWGLINTSKVDQTFTNSVFQLSLGYKLF